jgi:threonine/homoserine/homoserine lactone efflux protein
MTTSFSWFAWASFVVVTSITPGPNNAMLLSSGLRFGVRRTVPHILGVNLGFGFMLALTGLGLGAVILTNASLQQMMRYVSIALFVWMGYQMATAPYVDPNVSEDAGAKGAKPMGFFSAAAFQWINPKAWIMCFAASATFLKPSIGQSHVEYVQLAAMAGMFVLLGTPCSSSWALFGAYIRRWLADRKRQRVFNVLMGLALVASVGIF